MTGDQPPSAVGRENSTESGVGGDAVDEEVGGVRVGVGRDDGGGIELDHGSSFGTGEAAQRRARANLGIGVDYTLVGARAASRPRDHSPSPRSKGGFPVHAIGIDIGGTKIAGAVVDEFGAIVRSERVPTPAGDPAAARGRGRRDDRVALRRRRTSPPSASPQPGFIDAAQSTVYYAPNINWRNEPFREKLEARVGTTVVVDNDANAAGWAEFRFGAGRLVSDMVMLTIGTGVGGAIVAGDRLFRGGFGAGAELGHLRVVPDGIACGCGAARMPRAVRFRPRAAAHGERDRRRRRHRPGARAGARRARRARRRARRRAHRGRRTRARSPPCASSATGSARPSASPRRPCSTRSGSCSAAASPWRASCCSARSARRTSSTCPARGYHPEPDFVIAELVNDAGVVGAADLARVWVAEHA